ncbi:MAG: tRNA uridine-5-carboxymethylaminomethyl(34) synthesis enzyme MnmG [Coprobacillus sp.]|nr:tRNA uridine-5-carboxymethylaminomethyl(34) synthesis enzyme MnmG [Coprobacillus sp.]
MDTDYDVIVVGGGHAGLEAAFSCAHLNHKTLLITLNFEKIGNMPCNPSIGGSAKGIVVREIDALGGMMGKIADLNYLQMKMLNMGKGPGVWSLRSQQDKLIYPKNMQNAVKNCENLTCIEAMVVDLIHDDNSVSGVILETGEKIKAKATILTTGTYLKAQTFKGMEKKVEGPEGERSAVDLSETLKGMGLSLYRLKTGTPPRIARESIDFSKAKLEPGTPGNLAFSYETKKFVPIEDQINCYLIYTTPKTHKIIRKNLNKSALYSGQIQGVGPRYCPSIESKIVNFPDKERHQLFLEPESLYTNSIYLQGFSTSMDKKTQEKMVHSLPGFKKAKFLKYGYAIEYDAIRTEEYDATLAIKKYKGLYIGGQICGTSGYEEAAGLGLMAGINASRYIEGKEPIILKRDESYIGVMIDDLVTKGTEEPYRLLSSRAEYRLLLRHDNADMRLTKIGHDIGLISDERYNYFLGKLDRINAAQDLISKTSVKLNSDLSAYLKELGYDDDKGSVNAKELIKRPNVKLEKLLPYIDKIDSIHLTEEEVEEVEILIKYEGYIKKQEIDAEKARKLENLEIPQDIDYFHIEGLALEARQKLDKVRPKNIGQASRISGVDPSDISILIMTLKRGSK